MSVGAWIKAKMSLDSSGVKAGVDSAKKEVGGFKASLGGLGGKLTGAFGTAALVSFTKASIETASRTKDMAAAAGLATDQYQALYAKAMEFTGGAKALEAGLVSFRAAQESALDGNEEAISAFSRLGISIEDVANKSTPELLEAVAKGYRSVGDFGAIVDIFGKKNAAKLEEALAALATGGFGGLTNAMKAAGLVMGEDLSSQMDDLADATERMSLRMQTSWDRIIGRIAIFAEKTLFLIDQYNAGVSALNKADPGRKLSPKKQNAIRSEAEGQFAQDYYKKEAQRNSAVLSGREKLAADEKERRVKKLAAIQAAAEKKAADAAKKAENLKNKQIDSALDDFFGEVDDADVEARSSQAAEKAKAAAKVIEEGIAKVNDEADRMAEKAQRVEGGTAFTEIGGSAASAARPRYDTLREIGANILGSGKIGGAPLDRNAELIRINRQTAENTARIAEKLDSPPVTRLSQSTPVY